MYIFRIICSNNLSFRLYIDPKMNFSPRPFVNWKYNWRQVTESYGLGRRTWWSDVRNNLGVFRILRSYKDHFQKKKIVIIFSSWLSTLFAIKWGMNFLQYVRRNVHWFIIASIQSIKVFIGFVMQGHFAFFSSGIGNVTEETFLGCALLTSCYTK